MKFVNKFANLVSERSRAHKYKQFLNLLQPSPNDTILDCGANIIEFSDNDNILEKRYPYPERITALGHGDTRQLATLYPKIKVVSGNGTNLDFVDNEFDIAFSNAVIEHVGSNDLQVDFLRELHRVAKRGFLTTPNRHFPVEVHTRIPLLHLLPKRQFDYILTTVGKEWATGDYMHLLSKGDLERRLEAAGITEYKIIKNYFCGFVMTFTVVWDRRTAFF